MASRDALAQRPPQQVARVAGEMPRAQPPLVRPGLRSRFSEDSEFVDDDDSMDGGEARYHRFHKATRLRSLAKRSVETVRQKHWHNLSKHDIHSSVGQLTISAPLHTLQDLPFLAAKPTNLSLTSQERSRSADLPRPPEPPQPGVARLTNARDSTTQSLLDVSSTRYPTDKRARHSSLPGHQELLEQSPRSRASFSLLTTGLAGVRGIRRASSSESAFVRGRDSGNSSNSRSSTQSSIEDDSPATPPSEMDSPPVPPQHPGRKSSVANAFSPRSFNFKGVPVTRFSKIFATTASVKPLFSHHDKTKDSYWDHEDHVATLRNAALAQPLPQPSIPIAKEQPKPHPDATKKIEQRRRPKLSIDTKSSTGIRVTQAAKLRDPIRKSQRRKPIEVSKVLEEHEQDTRRNSLESTFAMITSAWRAYGSDSPTKETQDPVVAPKSPVESVKTIRSAKEACIPTTSIPKEEMLRRVESSDVPSSMIPPRASAAGSSMQALETPVTARPRSPLPPRSRTPSSTRDESQAPQAESTSTPQTARPRTPLTAKAYTAPTRRRSGSAASSISETSGSYACAMLAEAMMGVENPFAPGPAPRPPTYYAELPAERSPAATRPPQGQAQAQPQLQLNLPLDRLYPSAPVVSAAAASTGGASHSRSRSDEPRSNTASLLPHSRPKQRLSGNIDKPLPPPPPPSSSDDEDELHERRRGPLTPGTLSPPPSISAEDAPPLYTGRKYDFLPRPRGGVYIVRRSVGGMNSMISREGDQEGSEGRTGWYDEDDGPRRASRGSRKDRYSSSHVVGQQIQQQEGQREDRERNRQRERYRRMSIEHHERQMDRRCERQSPPQLRYGRGEQLLEEDSEEGPSVPSMAKAVKVLGVVA